MSRWRPPRDQYPIAQRGVARSGIIVASVLAREARPMYAWLVALHVIGVVVFLLCHAVSMWVAFRIRTEPDRAVVAALLGMSARGNQVMYLGFVLLGIGGLGAAGMAGWLTAPWVVASYVVLVVTIIAMYAIGAGFYYPIRDGLAGTEKTPRLD